MKKLLFLLFVFLFFRISAIAQNLQCVDCDCQNVQWNELHDYPYILGCRVDIKFHARYCCGQIQIIYDGMSIPAGNGN